MNGLIHNVQVFQEDRFVRGEVEIKNGRIHSVRLRDAKEAAPKPQDDRENSLARFDGHGAYLLPGLIDLHVHLVWDGSSDPVSPLLRERPEETLLRAVGHARETLYAGITTVRDLGSVHDLAIDLAAAVDRGHVPGPRIIASGRTIIMTGGHDPFWGIMADGEDEVRKATRRQAYRGAQVIKISATGGVYGRVQGEAVEDEELTQGEVRVVVEEAHRRGLPVAAHAIGRRGIENSVLAGVDTIEHGHQLTPELAGQLAEYGGALVPTLHVYRQIAEQPGIPAYAQEKARQIVEEHGEAVRLARDAGVLIGAGSDAGSPLTPHGALIDELLALVEAGLTPLEALASSTTVAAKILGRAGDLGRIEPGYMADLILVPENPLEDLIRLRQVSCIWKEGGLVRSWNN